MIEEIFSTGLDHYIISNDFGSAHPEYYCQWFESSQYVYLHGAVLPIFPSIQAFPKESYLIDSKQNPDYKPEIHGTIGYGSYKCSASPTRRLKIVDIFNTFQFSHKILNFVPKSNEPLTLEEKLAHINKEYERRYGNSPSQPMFMVYKEDTLIVVTKCEMYIIENAQNAFKEIFYESLSGNMTKSTAQIYNKFKDKIKIFPSISYMGFVLLSNIKKDSPSQFSFVYESAELFTSTRHTRLKDFVSTHKIKSLETVFEIL